MKRIFKKFQRAEGWNKFNTLFRFLIFILLLITIEQLFFEKDVTLWEVLENVILGTYGLGQYIIYGLYIISKMLVIIVPTIGAVLIVRLINYKDTLKVRTYRIASVGGIIATIFIWLVLFFGSYLYKRMIEENYLFFDPLTKWEEIFQLYEYVLPALILTFIDNTFTEIRSAKKIKQRKKLSQDVEKVVVEIFSEGNLTTAEQLHLLRNLKTQTNKHLKNRN